MAVYSELSENQLEKLLARAKAMCPMQTFKNYSEAPEISAPPTRKLPRTRTPQRRPAPKRSVAAPIANEIAYPEWIEQVKAFLRSIAAALSCALNAQARQDTPQVENRVDSILAQMTLDEKLDYISGEPINFASLKGVFNIK